VHWTLAHGDGNVDGQGELWATYNYGGMGGLMANYYSQTQPLKDCWQSEREDLPTGRWVCVAFLFDGGNDELRFWMDGVEREALHVMGLQKTDQTCTEKGSDGHWDAPLFSNIAVGWESYQHDVAGAHEAFIDDVVLDDEPVPCPLAPAQTSIRLGEDPGDRLPHDVVDVCGVVMAGPLHDPQAGRISLAGQPLRRRTLAGQLAPSLASDERHRTDARRAELRGGEGDVRLVEDEVAPLAWVLRRQLGSRVRALGEAGEDGSLALELPGEGAIDGGDGPLQVLPHLRVGTVPGGRAARSAGGIAGGTHQESRRAPGRYPVPAGVPRRIAHTMQVRHQAVLPRVRRHREIDGARPEER
jgi:hypothetical protein